MAGDTVARYDVAIIGAGLNGLTAAGCLAQARRRVLVLEARDRLGGTAASAELAPGFMVDPLAGPGRISDELRRDLDLDRHGLTLLAPESSLASVGPESESPLVLRRDQRQTMSAIRQRSPRDADRWPAFVERVGRLSGFLGWLYQRAPPRPKGAGLANWLDLAALGRQARTLGRANLVELLRVMPMPIADLVEDTFEDDRLRACIAAGAVAGIQQGPRSGGTTFTWLHHLVGSEPGVVGMQQRVRGGQGSLVEAIARAARGHGAEIRLSAPVTHIVTAGGRATGVSLENGDVIEADHVMSGAGIRRTLLDLVGPAVLDPEVVRAIQNIRYRGVVARVHLALDALPPFRGLSDDARDGVISITPGLNGIERAYDDAKYGRVSADPLLEVRVPSIADSSLAPPGKHVMSISVQYAPYQLRDGVWDTTRRDALGDLVLSRLSALSPGFADVVLHRQVLTPADIADGYGLPEGSIEHGELALDQALFMRPIPACAHYGTPVRGLYLCGTDMHPGRGVAGMAGRLAAKEVLKNKRG